MKGDVHGMQKEHGTTASQEWAGGWKLTTAAMLGYATAGLPPFAFGPFVTAIKAEFGWSLTQVMAGLSLSILLGCLLLVLVGLYIDRHGSRRVGLAGLLVMCGAFALLGTATGTTANWLGLWAIVGIGVVLVQPTVWTSAVASRFDRSRGLAIAVVLSGGALTAAAAPAIGTALLDHYGWRAAMAGVGGIWLAASFPAVFLFLKNARPATRVASAEPASPASVPAPAPIAAPAPQGLGFQEGLRTRGFACILISFCAFTFYSGVISPNLVRLLGDAGVTPMTAAAIASAMGAASICTRLAVGFLLDRFPGNVIGFVMQMLPVAGCALLLLPQPGVATLTLAVITFGMAIGAEMDVALYLATRHFGLRSFASLFGLITTAGSISSAAAPISSGWVYDNFGGYDLIIQLVMIVMAVGATSILLSGSPRFSTKMAHA